MRKKSRSRTPWEIPLALALMGIAASVGGCQWDSTLYDEFVVDNGQGGKVTECKELKRIIIQENEKVTRIEKGSGQYENAFEFDICPKEAPTCTYITVVNENGDNESQGICNNCPEKQSVCKKRCLNLDDNALHINNSDGNGCANDLFRCEDGYADVDGITTTGCEFNLADNHVDTADDEGKGAYFAQTAGTKVAGIAESEAQ